MAKGRTLYLVRHAIAEERGPKWPDDRLRPLRADGVTRMRRAVKGFDRLDEPISLVLTSPLTRALQTAEILTAGLSRKPEIATLPALAPGGAPSGVALALARYTKFEAIALVGHEPDLGELAAWLIGARAPLPFKKGAICRIDTTDWPANRQSCLIWAATPRILRKIG
jgi:phosphohistidine phosphatase